MYFLPEKPYNFLVTYASEQGKGLIHHTPMAPKLPVLQAGCQSSFPHDPITQQEFRYYKTLKLLEKVVIMCLMSSDW